MIEWYKIKGLIFCISATVLWGLGLFGNNVKDYIDRDNAFHLQDDPSMVLLIVGMMASAVFYFAIWPQRGEEGKIEFLDRKTWCVSMFTGALYSVANGSYYLCASSGVPSSILAPLSSIHILVPPLVGLFVGKKLTFKTMMGFGCSVCTLIALSGVLPGSHGKQDPGAPSGGEEGAMTLGTWLWMVLIIVGWGMGMVVQEQVGSAIAPHQFPQAHFGFAFGYSCILTIFSLSWQTGPAEIRNPRNWSHFGWPGVVMILTALFSGLGTGSFTFALQCWPNLNLMTALSSLYIVLPAVLGLAALGEPPTYNVFLGLFFAVLGVCILGMEVNESEEGRKPGTGDEQVPLLPLHESDNKQAPTPQGPAGNQAPSSGGLTSRIRRMLGFETGQEAAAPYPPTPKYTPLMAGVAIPISPRKKIKGNYGSLAISPRKKNQGYYENGVEMPAGGGGQVRTAALRDELPDIPSDSKDVFGKLRGGGS